MNKWKYSVLLVKGKKKIKSLVFILVSIHFLSLYVKLMAAEKWTLDTINVFEFRVHIGDILHKWFLKAVYHAAVNEYCKLR